MRSEHMLTVSPTAGGKDRLCLRMKLSLAAECMSRVQRGPLACLGDQSHSKQVATLQKNDASLHHRAAAALDCNMGDITDSTKAAKLLVKEVP